MGQEGQEDQKADKGGWEGCSVVLDVQLHPTLQCLTHQVGLECNPEIPVSPGEEH